MGLAGELKTIGLAEVFQNLAFNHHSGTLTLQAGRDRRARILFEEGRIRGVKVDGEEFDFVEIARHAQAAPEEALEKAAASNRRRTLRAFLRAAGSFDEAAFDAMVAGFVQEALLPLFGWRSASFSFEEGKRSDRVFGKEMLAANVDLDPMGVCMEAARRHDEWETIEPYVPSEEQVLVPAGPRPGELAPEQERLFALLDGTRTLGEVVKEAPLKKFEVFKAVAQLVETGALATATCERLVELAGASQTTGRVTLAAKQLETALALEPGDLDARRELVRLYERAGRQFDAAAELAKLGELQKERGDMQGALESYERACVLSPKDLDALERVFELHGTLGNGAQAVKTGRQLAEALAAEEMYEDALPLYERLLDGNPRNVGLRESLAACLLQVGESADAARHLLLVANRAFDQGEFEQALKYYRRVAQADAECATATRRIEEIESGAARARERFRRRRRWVAVLLVLLGLAAVQGGREWLAQGALHDVQHVSVSALARDHALQQRLDVLDRYGRVAQDYRLTRAGAQAAATAHALMLLEVSRAGTALDQAKGAKTTTDVEFGLERARAILAGVERVALPERSRQRWETERDELRLRLDDLQQAGEAEAQAGG